MKNPCEQCIVKGNCTKVCFTKVNLRTLLRDSIQRFRHNPIQSTRSVKLQMQLKEYCRLLAETNNDIWNIKQRKLNIENPCKDIPIKQEYNSTFTDV